MGEWNGNGGSINKRYIKFTGLYPLQYTAYSRTICIFLFTCFQFFFLLFFFLSPVTRYISFKILNSAIYIIHIPFACLIFHYTIAFLWAHYTISFIFYPDTHRDTLLLGGTFDQVPRVGRLSYLLPFPFPFASSILILYEYINILIDTEFESHNTHTGDI